MFYSMLCVKCASEDCLPHQVYETKHNGVRKLLKCHNCKAIFSETYQTFMFNLKTPLSKISQVLTARTEGISFNATCRLFCISTHTLKSWEGKFSGLKDTLLLYSLMHTFMEMCIEGDELYTKVCKNRPPLESEGWTISLMDRASRFLWELTCDKKQERLFLKAMERLSKVVSQTEALTLLTDGERRYSTFLFELCYDVIHPGKRKKPKKVFQAGLRVRLKNKGNRQRNTKKEKYETPKPEHPDTKQTLTNEAIHANHQEGQNAAYRRKNSAYRRKTNTYAKTKKGLQRTLDLYWVIHNFVRCHFTTREVPAVKIGILSAGLTLQEIMMNLRIVF